MKSNGFRNLKLLHPEILCHQTKVAIIGNAGTTPQDEKEISKADIVVRFNNYATRGGITHPADRLRCDILFTTTDLHSSGANPKEVVIGIPSPFKQEQVIRNLDMWYPRARYWMVNPYLNYELCKELELNSNGAQHPLPSVGFTALWHMQDWNACFYIGGFNWYVDLIKDTVQNKPIDLKILPSNFNHFYIKELNWIIRNLKRKKNILFSDSCMKILDHVEKKIA